MHFFGARQNVLSASTAFRSALMIDTSFSIRKFVSSAVFPTMKSRISWVAVIL
nr:hypothetical protein [Dubosiella newyorkensis]